MQRIPEEALTQISSSGALQAFVNLRVGRSVLLHDSTERTYLHAARHVRRQPVRLPMIADNVERARHRLEDCAVFGTQLIGCMVGSGSRKLIVGGAMPSFNALTVTMASTAPAAPMRWPWMGLVEDTASLSIPAPKTSDSASASATSLAMVAVPWALQ